MSDIAEAAARLRSLVGHGALAFEDIVLLNAAMHLEGKSVTVRALGPGTCGGFRPNTNPRYVSRRCADCGKTADEHRRWNDL